MSIPQLILVMMLVAIMGQSAKKYRDYLYHLRMGVLFPYGQIPGALHKRRGIRTVLKGVRTQSVYHLL